MKSKGIFWLKAAVIVAAAWWVYAPAVRGDWLWDDLQETTGNAVLRDPAGLGKIWFAPAGFDYFPLKTTVQWLQWHVWGDNAAADHATSICLHVLSAFLLWHLLKKLGVRLAWLGGLLFAIHPLAVESVAWNAELKNTLSLPLMLMAMIAYVDWDGKAGSGGLARPFARRDDQVDSRAFGYLWRTVGRDRPTLPLPSLVLFLAAMLCKSSVVMFPAVILLYCWWKRGRIVRADVRASAPFFAVSLVLGLVTVWFQQHRAIAGLTVALGGFLPRLAGAGLAVAFYFEKCVIPVGFLPIYPRWNVDPPSPLQFLPWIGLAGLVWWLWTKRAGWGRHALFGLGFFLLNLLPVLGFIPMFYLRLSWVADHFAYLPLVGMVGLAAAGVSAMGPMRRIGPIVIVLAAALALESRHYAGIFRNEETLWTYTLQRNPAAWQAHYNLGEVFNNDGRLRDAISQYEEAVRLKPDFLEAQAALGEALANTGQYQEGMAHLSVALRLNPNYAKAYVYLGFALTGAGRLPEAIASYGRALQLDPDNAAAHANLGFALASSGRIPEAISEYEQALKLKPDFSEARDNLGNALAHEGRLPEATAQYEEAIRLNPGYAEARFNLGNALARSGSLPRAIEQYERGLQLMPDYAEAHNNLGSALVMSGSVAAGIEQYRMALRLRPDYSEARRNLDLALRKLQNASGAP